MALEKPGKLREFFLLLCGHLVLKVKVKGIDVTDFMPNCSGRYAALQYLKHDVLCCMQHVFTVVCFACQSA